MLKLLDRERGNLHKGVLVGCAVLLVTLLGSGCTWVTLTQGGMKSRVLDSGDVSSCRQIGESRSSVQAGFWFLKRNSAKVKSELENLARNEAAEMGGDTIVPTSDVKNGTQTYAIYRCLN